MSVRRHHLERVHADPGKRHHRRRAGPAAAVLNGTLYLFGKGIGDKQIYVSAFDGATWSAFSRVANGSTDVAPGVGVLNDQLYLFTKGIGDKKLYFSAGMP